MAFNPVLKGGRVMQWIYDKQMANRYGKITSLQYVILLPHSRFIVSVNYFSPFWFRQQNQYMNNRFSRRVTVITLLFCNIFSVISSNMP